MKLELNKIIHADCMDIMKDIPDKYFELAIEKDEDYHSASVKRFEELKSQGVLF